MNSACFSFRFDIWSSGQNFKFSFLKPEKKNSPGVILSKVSANFKKASMSIWPIQ